MVTKKQMEIVNKIRDRILENSSFVSMCLLKLYEKQTDFEQKNKSTSVSNRVGYNKSDAYILTDYSIWILNRSNLNNDYLIDARNRLHKYTIQLSNYDDIINLLNGVMNTKQLKNKFLKILTYEKIKNNISLSDFIDYRINNRKEESKRRQKERRESKRLEQYRESCTIVEGKIKKIRPYALLLILNNNAYWFPKRSVKNKYLEVVDKKQEFWILNTFYENKKKTKTFSTKMLKGNIIEIRNKALSIYFADKGVEYWIPKFAIKSKYIEEIGIIQEFEILNNILDDSWHVPTRAVIIEDQGKSMILELIVKGKPVKYRFPKFAIKHGYEKHGKPQLIGIQKKILREKNIITK